MSRPWMPLYVADYLRDTRRLTAAEHGAYLLLIMEYWTSGKLPIDDRQLSRIACMTPAEWRRSRPNVQPFFTDKWTHKRIDAELAKSAEISSKRSASAKLKHSNRNANAEQLDTHAGATSQSQIQPQERKQDAAEAALGSDEKQLYDLGKLILGPTSGGFIKKLVTAKDGSIPLARAALEVSRTKSDPKEYLGAIVRNREDPECRPDRSF